MATDSFRIEVGPELQQWARGLGSVRLTAEEAALWQQAMDVYFDETQRRVHILSGDLKASGRVEGVDLGRAFVAGEVVYGGGMGTEGPVDYAWYEFRRGGSHDPILPAVTRMMDMFGDTIDAALRNITARATGGL